MLKPDRRWCTLNDQERDIKATLELSILHGVNLGSMIIGSILTKKKRTQIPGSNVGREIGFAAKGSKKTCCSPYHLLVESLMTEETKTVSKYKAAEYRMYLRTNIWLWNRFRLESICQLTLDELSSGCSLIHFVTWSVEGLSESHSFFLFSAQCTSAWAASPAVDAPRVKSDQSTEPLSAALLIPDLVL